MTIEERIASVEKTFDELQAQRKQHLDSADELWQEMIRLQGEHRALKKIAEEVFAEPVDTINPEGDTPHGE